MGETGGMMHPESTHPFAAWTRHPLGFAAAIAVLGALSFGAALLMPVGIPAVALAAAGAVAAVAGLLTALILLLARITGLRDRSDRAVQQGRASSSRSGTRVSAPADAPATPVAPAAASERHAQPAPAAEIPIEDHPTQPLVLDLTDDDRQHSPAR